jgi:hypothetical protein
MRPNLSGKVAHGCRKQDMVVGLLRTTGWVSYQAFTNLRFSGIDPAALSRAVGKKGNRQRGGEHAEENLSPERGILLGHVAHLRDCMLV